MQRRATSWGLWVPPFVAALLFPPVWSGVSQSVWQCLQWMPVGIFGEKPENELELPLSGPRTSTLFYQPHPASTWILSFDFKFNNDTIWCLTLSKGRLMRKLYQVELCGISISIDSPKGELKIHLTLIAHVIYDKDSVTEDWERKDFSIYVIETTGCRC